MQSALGSFLQLGGGCAGRGTEQLVDLAKLIGCNHSLQRIEGCILNGRIGRLGEVKHLAVCTADATCGSQLESLAHHLIIRGSQGAEHSALDIAIEGKQSLAGGSSIASAQLSDNGGEGLVASNAAGCLDSCCGQFAVSRIHGCSDDVNLTGSSVVA